MVNRRNDPDGPRKGPGSDAAAAALSKAWALVHESGSEEDLQKAVRALQRRLRSHPDDAAACCLLSEAHLALGEVDEALDAALAAAALAGPDDPEPFFRTGMALYDLAAIPDDPGSPGERVEPALHFIEAALGIPPVRNPELVEEALRLFEVAEERGDDSSGPPLWAGICLFNLGRFSDAREAFKAAAGREGTGEALADAWFLQGLAAEEMEEERQAAEAYRIALGLHADHRGAQIRLRWIEPGERDRFLDPEQVQQLRGRIEEALSASGEPAEACSGKLETARKWAGERGISADDLEGFLVYHGAACDCEVLLNLEARLGLAPPGEDAGGGNSDD